MIPLFSSIFLTNLDPQFLALGFWKIPHKKKIKNNGTECSSRKCGFQNSVVLSNTSAYGVCGKCEKYEHFRCAKTKEDEKEDILSGKQPFYCSNCLFKYPSEIAHESNAGEPVNNPIRVQAIVHDNPVNEKDNCGINFELEEHPEAGDLNNEKAREPEMIQDISSETSSGLETFQCELCDFK